MTRRAARLQAPEAQQLSLPLFDETAAAAPAPSASPSPASPASPASPGAPPARGLRSRPVVPEEPGTIEADADADADAEADADADADDAPAAGPLTGPVTTRPAVAPAFDMPPRIGGAVAPSHGPQAIARALQRHARANREARLGGELIAYELRRARRRTIGFVVSDEGLTVSAPRWVPQGEIDAGLQEKSRWILRKLGEQAERVHKLQSSRIAWGDGAVLPFLGEPVVVVLDPRIVGARLDAGEGVPQGTLDGVPRRTLHVGLPPTAAPGQVRDQVQVWLQRQARRIFEERCALYSPRLQVRVTRLALSSAGTRWGSASADGSIRLNWRLVHLPMATIDYVVCHELAHLRHMDHSPRFWDVVRSVLPDYECAREALREEPVPPLD
jgi:predicted metal-dependent hydrolase